MAEFIKPEGWRFAFKGVNLRSSPDAIPPDKYSSAVNIRAISDQSVSARPGYVLLFAAASNNSAITDIRSYAALGSDDSPRFLARNALNQIVLDNGATVATLAGNNNGTGCAMIPFRPEASPQAWMYVANGYDYQKISAPANNNVTVQKVGIAEPQLPLDAAPIVSSWYNFSGGNWTAGGTGSNLSAGNRVSDAAANSVADPVNSNRHSVTVGNAAAYQTGEIVTVGGTAAVVQDVIPPIAPVTIQGIHYDSGSAGNCVIVPSRLPIGQEPSGLPQLGFLRRGALINIGAETVFVRGVSAGTNGALAFETSTAGTYSAGQSITGLPVIIVYNASAGAITAAMFSFTQAAGIGYATQLLGTNPFTQVALQPEDYIHVSLQVGDPTQIVELQIQFNVDATDTTFTQNYLYYAVDPSILAGVVTGQATQSQAILSTGTSAAIQTLQQELNTIPVTVPSSVRQSIQNQINTLKQQLGQNPPASASGATVAGFTQWTEVMFPISALTRVGNDQTRTLANCKSVRIWVNSTGAGTASWQPSTAYAANQLILDSNGHTQKVTTPGTSGTTLPAFNNSGGTTADGSVVWTDQGSGITATTSVAMSSLWVGGGSQPDVGDSGAPYSYIGVPRSSLTGARGNPSPVMRYGVNPRRQSVLVQTSAVSNGGDTQIDVIDVYRYGGTVTQFGYIGTAAYGTDFTDNYFDDAVQTAIGNGNVADYTNLEPWPSIGPPFKSTGTVLVIGTVVIVTDATAGIWPTNVLNWLPGTLVTIGGQQAYTLRRRPLQISSTSYLFTIEESAGYVASAGSVYVPEPIVGRQFAPYMDGPDAYGTVFAVGDQLRPGGVYYCKANTPDSAPSANYLELCSPSEPLLRPFVLQTITLVMSSSRWWSLYPKFGGTAEYTPIEQPVGKSAVSPWGCCKDGLRVFFWSKFGIESTNGGAAESLTDEDLYSLFPHEGVQGQGNVTGTNIVRNGITYYAPDYRRAASFRLARVGVYLFADYPDINGVSRTLVCDLRTNGWSQDIYALGGISATCHYAPEQQAGTLLSGTILYPAMVMGEANGRVLKEQAYTNDDTTPIQCQIGTFEWDGGDQRAQPNFGDAYVDAVSLSPLTVQPYSLGAVVGLPTVIPVSATRSFSPVSVGGQQTLKYLGLSITWTDDYSLLTSSTRLHLWQLSSIPQPVIETDRVHDWIGGQGAAYFRGFTLEGDTFGAKKIMNVRSSDDMKFQDFIGPNGFKNIIQLGNQDEQAYSFVVPFVSHYARLEPGDQLPWRYFGAPFGRGLSWIADPWPEMNREDGPWIKLFPDSGAAFLQGMVIPMETGGEQPDLEILTDASPTTPVALTSLVTPTANVKTAVSFSLPTPIICHEVQIIRKSPCRIWTEEINWMAQRTPEFGVTWQTQFSGFGMEGWKTVPLIEAAWSSIQEVFLSTAVYDGTAPGQITLPASGGAYQRKLFSLSPNKAQLYAFAAVSGSPFQIYLEDFIVYVGQWGRKGPMVPYRNIGGTFGDKATI